MKKGVMFVIVAMVMVLGGCSVKSEMVSQVRELCAQLDTSSDKQATYNEWLKTHAVPVVEGEKMSFLFWDEGATRVILETALVKSSDHKVAMQRYKNTPLFVATLPLREQAVVDYSFIRYDEKTPNGKRVLDQTHPFVAYTKPIMSRWMMPGVKKGRLIITNYKPANGLVSRRIFIYLPWNYTLQTNENYPVLFMHDGQNLWDSQLANFGGWKVDTTLDRLIADEKIPPIVVVGIENSSARAEEYVGFSAYYKWSEPYDTNEQKRVIEYSQKYLDFVVNDLKPWIEKNYRVRKNDVVVAGSSFGAGVSLYIGLSRPDVFRAIGAFSFGNYSAKDVNRGIRRVLQVQPYLSDRLMPPDGKHKIYLDCGGRGIDTIFVEAARKLHQDLLKKGWKEGESYLYVEDPSADHNEMAWAKRFERFVLFVWQK